eukprot:1194921-Prorocentrum_minimum.AAC.1
MSIVHAITAPFYANVRGARRSVKNHHSTIISTRANDGGAATSMLPWMLYCNDQASIPTLIDPSPAPCACDHANHAKPQQIHYAPAAADGDPSVLFVAAPEVEARMGRDVISKIKITVAISTF